MATNNGPWNPLLRYPPSLRASHPKYQTQSERSSCGLTKAKYVSIPHDSCNTPGVCHQLSNGFKLKHDMLSGDEGVKIKSIYKSELQLKLGQHTWLAYWPFSDIYLSNVEGASFMCLTYQFPPTWMIVKVSWSLESRSHMKWPIMPLPELL